jgi:peptidoglycan/xylan/chitin deacetylase (PgdA/CDA1 family)
MQDKRLRRIRVGVISVVVVAALIITPAGIIAEENSVNYNVDEETFATTEAEMFAVTEVETALAGDADGPVAANALAVADAGATASTTATDTNAAAVPAVVSYKTSAADDEGNPATGPAVKSVSLDADELLFGKKGAKLKLKTTVQPKNADLSGLKYKSSDESVATVTKNGKVKAKGWGVCDITVTVGDKKDTCKVTVAKKWVALTFDDGPGNYTDKLLKAMKKQGVRATFFVVGQMAQSRTSLLKKMVKNGNEIGNHTYAHDGSAGALMNALKKTDKIVKKATGHKTALMRPPGGAMNEVTRRCGKPIILWSVDPLDWRDRNANTVYQRVMKSTKSGGIVLLHDIHPTSVDAAIRIMKTLKSKGYAFVTVSELLGNPKANKVYNKGPGKVRTMKIKY